MPECKDSQGNLLDPASPQIDSVSDDARPCWYFSYDTTCGECAEDIGLRPTGTVSTSGHAPGDDLPDLSRFEPRVRGRGSRSHLPTRPSAAQAARGNTSPLDI